MGNKRTKERFSRPCNVLKLHFFSSPHHASIRDTASLGRRRRKPRRTQSAPIRNFAQYDIRWTAVGLVCFYICQKHLRAPVVSGSGDIYDGQIVSREASFVTQSCFGGTSHLCLVRRAQRVVNCSWANLDRRGTRSPTGTAVGRLSPFHYRF